MKIEAGMMSESDARIFMNVLLPKTIPTWKDDESWEEFQLRTDHYSLGLPEPTKEQLWAVRQMNGSDGVHEFLE